MSCTSFAATTLIIEDSGPGVRHGKARSCFRGIWWNLRPCERNVEFRQLFLHRGAVDRQSALEFDLTRRARTIRRSPGPGASRIPCRSFISVVCRYLPTGASLARHGTGVRDADIGEEHLVEVRRPGHLPDWSDFDTGCFHVKNEKRQARVFHRIRIGAGDQDSVIAVMRARVPDLLCPFDTHASPSFSARVRSAARSDPPPGFENNLAPDVVGPHGFLDEFHPLFRRAPGADGWQFRQTDADTKLARQVSYFASSWL